MIESLLHTNNVLVPGIKESIIHIQSIFHHTSPVLARLPCCTLHSGHFTSVSKQSKFLPKPSNRSYLIFSTVQIVPLARPLHTPPSQRIQITVITKLYQEKVTTPATGNFWITLHLSMFAILLYFGLSTDCDNTWKVIQILIFLWVDLFPFDKSYIK